MANVRKTSTMYFTSRKKRLAAENTIASATASTIRGASRTGSQRRETLNPAPTTIRNRLTTTPAMRKSTSCEKTAASGKMTRGKYTLVMRSVFATRLFVPKRSAETKKAHGAAFTVTEVMSDRARGVPETFAKAKRT